jgi:selenocysteine lyase/cysteine desulfurase
MPVATQWAYFDHAAVAPLPAPTAKAIEVYAQQASRNGDVYWPIWSLQVAQLRSGIARFIEANADEVALVNNTTQGISLIAEGFPWQSGDNVVIPENEFPSNALPWRNLKRLGVELRRVPVAPSGVIELADLEAAMDGHTRIVSVSWVGFASGYRIDVPAVAELVHRRGALFMLDAIQGLGAFPISVRECQVDFLAADGHKWLLGPEGAGMLFVRREHLDMLQPLGIGWNSLAASGFDPQAVELKTSAARYEGGSTNMPGMLGLQSSVQLLSELHVGRKGSCPIADSILANVDQLTELLRRADFKVSLPQERERQSGIVGITWGESDSPPERLMAARKHCLAAGVVLSVRAGRLRASTHAYNNLDDIRRLVEALSSFRRDVE